MLGDELDQFHQANNKTPNIILGLFGYYNLNHDKWMEIQWAQQLRSVREMYLFILCIAPTLTKFYKLPLNLFSCILRSFSLQKYINLYINVFTPQLTGLQCRTSQLNTDIFTHILSNPIYVSSYIVMVNYVGHYVRMLRLNIIPMVL